MKPVLKKGAMLGLSLLLLTAAAIYLTTAWYTKMVSVSGVEFKAAQWDFTANHTVDDMVINVYEYASLNEKLAAPGTAGWIPITLGATESDTDINFQISVDKSSMSEEFQARISFYYKNAAGERQELGSAEQFLSGVIPHGGQTTANIYWEWLYEAPATVTDPQARTAWDEFDTQVGQNPALYVGDMSATLSIAGAQSVPVQSAAGSQ